jgi:integrase
MPRPRKPPHVIRRKGRSGLHAYLSRDEPHVPLGTDDEHEAQRRLAELLDARRLRATAPSEPIGRVFAEHLTRSRTNHTPKTCYEHGLNGRRLLRWLLDRKVTTANQITREVVEDYKTARRFEQAGPARINAELNTLRGVLKIAAELGHAAPAAPGYVAKLREPRPEPHRVGLTKAEIARLLKAEPHAGYRAMFRVVIGTGMRDEEVRHMEAGDVRRTEIVVTPKPGWSTKGYRYRSIDVTPATVKAAKAFLAAKPTMNLDKKRVWQRIQAARKAAEIGKHFSLHDLRRAWASHMLSSGACDIEELSKMLGHADMLTTMRYLRVVSGRKIDPKRLPF